MKNKKISLSVKRDRYRCDDPTAEEADKIFKKIRKEILKRDNYTCQFCGLKSLKYQEVHHVNDNHHDNSEKNLITICSLCHSCFHIGFSGQKEKGIIIYINPELNLEQSELNNIVRTLWIGEKSKNSTFSLICTNLLARFNKAAVLAERELGTSDPLVLGDALLKYDEKTYKKRNDVLNGFYFLPFVSAYLPQLNYWNDNIYKNIPTDKWLDIATDKILNWSKNKFGNSKIESIMETLK